MSSKERELKQLPRQFGQKSLLDDEVKQDYNNILDVSSEKMEELSQNVRKLLSCENMRTEFKLKSIDIANSVKQEIDLVINLMNEKINQLITFFDNNIQNFSQQVYKYENLISLENASETENGDSLHNLLYQQIEIQTQLENQIDKLFAEMKIFQQSIREINVEVPSTNSTILLQPSEIQGLEQEPVAFMTNPDECYNIIQLDFNHFLTSGPVKRMTVWNFSQYKPILNLKGHSGVIGQRGVIKMTDKIIISGASDQIIQYWDWKQGKEIENIKALDAVLAILKIDNGAFAVSTSNQQISIYNFIKKQRIYDFDTIGCNVTAMIYYPNLQYLVAGGDDPHIRVWILSSHQGTELCQLKAHTDNISCFGQIGDIYMVSGGKDQQMKYWNLKERSLITIVPGNTDNVTAILPIDSDKFFTVSEDKSIRLWSFKDQNSVFVRENADTEPIYDIQYLDRGIFGTQSGKGIHFWKVSFQA